jgi:hypothetical protein
MAALDNCYNIFDMREAAKRRLPLDGRCRLQQRRLPQAAKCLLQGDVARR